METFTVKILNNTQSDKLAWADYRKEFKTKKFNSIEQLKEWFYVAAIGKVALKYVDIQSKKPKIYDEDLETDFFGNIQLDWLLGREANKNKYIELQSLDYRIMAA